MFNIFEIFELFCGELIQKNILATPKNVKQSIVLLTFGIFFQHQTFLVYKWIVHENQQLFLHCLRFTFLLHANEIRYFVGLSENCFFLVDLYGFGYFGIWLHNATTLNAIVSIAISIASVSLRITFYTIFNMRERD